MADTPLRSIRIPDEIWIPAQNTAEAEGETISDVVRRALIEYAEAHPAPRRTRKGMEA